MSNHGIGGPFAVRGLPNLPRGGNENGAGIRAKRLQQIGEMLAPGPLYPYPIYPNNGYPSNPGENRPGLSPFGRLAKGQGLGKSTLLRYNPAVDGPTPSPVTILRVEGDDVDATQLCITLVSPRVIALDPDDADVGNQNLTGEQDNAEITSGNFPGTVLPIRWPPIEAVLEWGVRGTQARAVVDFVNGMTVNVVASFLNVHAVISQSAPDTIQGTPANYWLAAFVGPGYSKTGTPRRTIYIGDLAVDTESQVFDVPKFAHKVMLVGHDDSAVPNVSVAFVRFWQSPDGTNNVGNFFQSANQPGPFDVPNGAQYFTCYNQSGVEMPFSAVFELAI